MLKWGGAFLAAVAALAVAVLAISRGLDTNGIRLYIEQPGPNLRALIENYETQLTGPYMSR